MYIKSYGIAAFAEQGLLEPLQSYIDKDSYDLGSYLNGQVDGWKAMGPDDQELQIYGLPFIGDARVIVYDRQLFDEWGWNICPSLRLSRRSWRKPPR